MGTDPDLFVNSESISSQLYCPICTQILENPVQTPTEHLFCEDELLEWMSRSKMPLCPVTNETLDPNSIRKPSRIILNMLGELKRHCTNRKEGCTWTGNNEDVDCHVAQCSMRSREDIMKELGSKEKKIDLLKKKCATLHEQLQAANIQNSHMKEEVSIYRRKLRVYEAFFQENANEDTAPGAGRGETDSTLQRMLDLRNLKSLTNDEAYDKYIEGSRGNPKK